jgi:two-component system, NarL family, invasion response regulator UvrY
MNKGIQIALADDHVILRSGLTALINNFGYSVLFECGNGREVMEKVSKGNLPDIILMDINMPVMDGFETTLWLKRHYPLVHVLALSMYDDEIAIIRMLKNGAKGYIPKESEPKALKMAIDSVLTKGFHYSDRVTGTLLHSIDENDPKKALLNLSEKDIEFLKLVSTEMTYKEIAAHMHLSPRTIDGYRDALFERLNVKSRVGLVLFAIKNRIVQFN